MPILSALGRGAPMALAFEKGSRAATLDLAQVLQVGVAVTRLEEIELDASREGLTLPATLQSPIPVALPDLAMGRTTVATTCPLAAQLRQGFQHLAALWEVLKGFEKWDLGKGLRQVRKPFPLKLFAQVAGQISNCALIARTIAAVQATVRDQLLLLILDTLGSIVDGLTLLPIHGKRQRQGLGCAAQAPPYVLCQIRGDTCPGRSLYGKERPKLMSSI